MKLKKMIYISTALTFLLCFITHFLYDWFPSPFTALFFPVNESIWEHMKMLYTTILLYGILEYFIVWIKKISIHNFLISLFLKAFLSIPIYLIIYLPIYFMIGEKMIVSILLLVIVLWIVNFIGYKIESLREIKYGNAVATIFIILGFVLMGYFTYNPPRNFLFLDTEHEKYGIREYVL